MMRPRYASGPVVWLATIAITTLLLVASTKALWLVVPILLAIILYYLLYPAVHRLMLSGVRREVAASLVVGGFTALAVAVMIPTLPWLTAQAVSGEEAIGRYVDGGWMLVDRMLVAVESQFRFLERMNFHASVGGKLATLRDTWLHQELADTLLAIAVWLPSLLLAPFVAFFLLRDGRQFLKLLTRGVPNAFFERTMYMVDRVHTTARAYFGGLMKLTIIDTLFLAAGLWLIGIPGPLLLGLVAAVLAWIPVVGSAIGCVLVVLVAATSAPNDTGIVYAAIALFILVRLCDDFIFMPLTVGRSLRLHPVPTVLMLFIGGAAAGIPGLILALPLTGVVKTIAESIGGIVEDPRLRARHAYAKSLEAQRIQADLHL
jgi:predicted PurR-regulated permease PerM